MTLSLKHRDVNDVLFCFSCTYAITTLNVLVMAADENSCYRRLSIYIILSLFIHILIMKLMIVDLAVLSVYI